jgi:hypothetical protein
MSNRRISKVGIATLNLLKNKKDCDPPFDIRNSLFDIRL